MTCQHNKYRTSNYMCAPNVFRAMKKKDCEICWVGITVKQCEDCGEDISKYMRVEVKTVGEYMGALKIDRNTKKRKGKHG